MRITPEITAALMRTTDDLGQRSPEYQEELGKVWAAVREEDSSVGIGTFTMDSVGGGMWFTGEFTFLKAIGPAAVVAFGGWLASRNGRKLRIKVGDVEAEANSIQDLNKLLKLADEIKQASEPKHIHEA